MGKWLRGRRRRDMETHPARLEARRLEVWRSALWDGRAEALRKAHHALAVSRFCRETRGYGWRAICADQISKAGYLRRAVQAGEVQG